MVRRRSGGRRELLRCGVSWNTRRLARTTRVGHPVPDVAAPAAKVFRIGADPGAWIDRDQNGSQAELRHSAWAPVSSPRSALGLFLSRALSSAQAVFQSEAVVPFTQSLPPRDWPTVRLSRASRNRRSRSPRIRAPTPAVLSQCDASERTAHSAKPIDTVPFPLISIWGTGTPLPGDQSSRCHPAAVRLNRPARSSDSSTSPRRSFLTTRQSPGLARVSTMPPAKLSRTRLVGLRGFPSVCRATTSECVVSRSPLFQKGAQAMSMVEKTKQRTTSDAKLETKPTRPQPTAKKPAPKPGPTPRAKQRPTSRNPELRITDPLDRITTISYDRSD